MSTHASLPPGRQTDRGREFVADHPVQSITVAGAPACLVSVRLTSYRSLPLSCIEEISLWLNGQQVERERIELVLEGHVYALDQLSTLPHLWWFILDVAQLRVRLSEPLAAGEHQIRGQLVTVEPYVSNGRFHFFSNSERTLSVVTGPQEGVFHV